MLNEYRSELKPLTVMYPVSVIYPCKIKVQK